jgi:hypothetical protein
MYVDGVVVAFKVLSCERVVADSARGVADGLGDDALDG